MTAGGVPVELTATEYELVRVPSLDAGRVVTFETLLRRVWPKRENARREPGAQFRQEPAPQAGRQRRQPRIPLQRARRRLPHGEAAGPLRPSARARRPAAGAPPNRMPERPGFAAPARDRDDGPLSHPESQPARGAAPPEHPAITAPIACIDRSGWSGIEPPVMPGATYLLDDLARTIA